MLPFMDYLIFLYLTPFFLLAMTFLLVQCWRRWEISSARFLFFCAVSALGFLLFNTLELVLADPDLKILCAKIEHVWIAGIADTWLLFTLDFTGRRDWARPRRFWPFAVPAAVDILLVFTNEHHGLIWASHRFVEIEGLLALQVVHGAGYFVLMVMQYSLPVIGMVLLLGEFSKSQDLYRSQIRWMIAGAVISLAFNVLYISRILPWLRKDYSPLGYALAVLAFSVGIFRYRLFQLVPIPRSRLFDSLVDGILVLDRKNRIIDLNESAGKILGLSKNDVGTSAYRCSLLLPLFENTPVDSDVSRSQDVSVDRDGETFHYDIRLSRERSPAAGFLGSVIVLHDITERVRLFEEVKTLRGIVPICGKCKRVRTDEGYWQQVEAYVSDHSYAEFSHGLCPECLEEYYPPPKTPIHRRSRR